MKDMIPIAVIDGHHATIPCILVVLVGKVSLYKDTTNFDKAVISTNRFYSEVWLFERSHRQFSAFDTIADLYFVRFHILSIQMSSQSGFDKVCFSFTYNMRKIEKHIFKYNYKKRCQKRFQKLKNEI